MFQLIWLKKDWEGAMTVFGIDMVLLVVIGLIVIVLGVAVGVKKGTRSVLTTVDLNILSRQTVPCQIRLLFASEREQVNCRLAVLPS